MGRGGSVPGVRLVHDPIDGPTRPIATRVVVADSFLQRARGLMFRRSFPEGHAMLFRFSAPKSRTLHMVFVPFPIDAIWLRDGVVERTARLRPWVGLARGRGDVIVELPAGAAEGVRPGDRLSLVRGDDRADRRGRTG